MPDFKFSKPRPKRIFPTHNKTEKIIDPNTRNLHKLLDYVSKGMPFRNNREYFIFGKDKLLMPLDEAMRNAQLKNIN